MRLYSSACWNCMPVHSCIGMGVCMHARMQVLPLRMRMRTLGRRGLKEFWEVGGGIQGMCAFAYASMCETSCEQASACISIWGLTQPQLQVGSG